VVDIVAALDRRLTPAEQERLAAAAGP
jgi:hypothetical protein